MKHTIKYEIKKMPKIELHFHFEGAFRLNSLWILSKKYHPDVSYEQFKCKFKLFYIQYGFIKKRDGVNEKRN